MEGDGGNRIDIVLCKKYLKCLKLLDEYFNKKIKLKNDFNENNIYTCDKVSVFRYDNTEEIYEILVNNNNLNFVLIKNFVEILYTIKVDVSTSCGSEMIRDNSAKFNIEFFLTILNKFFPKNVPDLKFSLDGENFINKFYCEDLNEHFLNKIEIQLLLKIQNFNIFQFSNALLLSTFMNKFKFFEYSISILNLSKAESFIFDKKISFDLYENSTQFEQLATAGDEVLEYLRYRLLTNYLVAVEKTHLSKKKISEIFKLFRKSTIEKDNIICNVLINFIIRQFVLNKSYLQAQNYFSKISIDITESMVLSKQKIRFYYYVSYINLIQCEYKNSFKYSRKCLEDITNSLKLNESFNISKKFFLKVIIIFAILQIIDGNKHFLSNNQIIKAIENILKNFLEQKSGIYDSFSFDLNYSDYYKKDIDGYGDANNSIIKLLRKSLISERTHVFPYFFIFSSIINGKLIIYEEFLKKFQTTFASDGLFLVISRLSRYVLFYGLRKLNKKYENQMVNIDTIIEEMNIKSFNNKTPPMYSKESVLGIIAKNISEGVINAKIIIEKSIIDDKHPQKIFINFFYFKSNLINSSNYIFNSNNEITKSNNNNNSRNGSILSSTDISIDNNYYSL